MVWLTLVEKLLNRSVKIFFQYVLLYHFQHGCCLFICKKTKQKKQKLCGRTWLTVSTSIKQTNIHNHVSIVSYAVRAIFSQSFIQFLSLWSYGSRDFEIDSCHQNGSFTLSASMDYFYFQSNIKTKTFFFT